jgi:hypothetical protein
MIEVVEMKQKIMCQKGKCWEETSNDDSSHFEEMFNESNIVKKIEKDLFMEFMYGE